MFWTVGREAEAVIRVVVGAEVLHNGAAFEDALWGAVLASFVDDGGDAAVGWAVELVMNDLWGGNEIALEREEGRLTIDVEEPWLFLHVLRDVYLVHCVLETQLFQHTADLLAIGRAGRVASGIIIVSE